MGLRVVPGVDLVAGNIRAVGRKVALEGEPEAVVFFNAGSEEKFKL